MADRAGIEELLAELIDAARRCEADATAFHDIHGMGNCWYVKEPLRRIRRVLAERPCTIPAHYDALDGAVAVKDALTLDPRLHNSDGSACSDGVVREGVSR